MTNTLIKQHSVHAQQLWFTGVEQVEVRGHIFAAPRADELLVEVECSAISAGTEMLVYRGQIPNDMALDATITALQDQQQYPLQYGYASVGIVKTIGTNVDTKWLGQRVFAFQPHSSHFIATPANLIPVPADIAAEDAVFLPNMETAVNLIQDGSPALGERVVVLGQGVVGLLATHLLTQFPLADLLCVDAIPLRRERALQLGVNKVFDPFSTADISALKQQLTAAENVKGADLIYEVSGAPDALNLAIALSGFSSRIVIGSWYGNKAATIALGGDAHRNRLKITTSQVSSLAPELSGRWDKTRRFEMSWHMLRNLRPSQLITHRVPLSDAPALYQRLHQSPAEILQAIFSYSNA
ncbi:zinc-dependent alcohol dehydrogenase [Cellvibrio fibrivorans]|uniref:2-desacetyl-2-hydroxyethyl bacteriochlorophyllide A dehydrogenase n=1 Tax=Cellvibrio fibrivorans TaxID=126350 RepID=A0ABU1UYN7_9GAMM|nr:zinc-binding alcohol dehydrogenase [Cellvibrio fibrivorans]MDR7090217.1 2-desacetyl-2-hydroxyethyl bacteriochlorophyllide A dehydrogenase [Cellvibrio fibrivorans]